MTERRAALRRRVCLGGRVSYNDRKSTMDCVVRDLTEGGARVQFPDFTALPHQLEFSMPAKGTVCAATVVWQYGDSYGLSFPKTPNADSSLEVLRALERNNKLLRRSMQTIRDP